MTYRQVDIFAWFASLIIKQCFENKWTLEWWFYYLLGVYIYGLMYKFKILI